MSNPIKYGGLCPPKCPTQRERLILNLMKIRNEGKNAIDSAELAKRLNLSNTQSASHKLLGISGIKRTSDRTWEFTGEEIK